MKNIFFAKININRDWKIVISFFSVCLVAVSILAWKIYLSNYVGGGLFSVDSTTVLTPIKVVDKEKLEKSLYLLKKNAESGSVNRTRQIKPVDPSI